MKRTILVPLSIRCVYAWGDLHCDEDNCAYFKRSPNGAFCALGETVEPIARNRCCWERTGKCILGEERMKKARGEE